MPITVFSALCFISTFNALSTHVHTACTQSCCIGSYNTKRNKTKQQEQQADSKSLSREVNANTDTVPIPKLSLRELFLFFELGLYNTATPVSKNPIMRRSNGSHQSLIHLEVRGPSAFPLHLICAPLSFRYRHMLRF
ncbi:hypothetical protein BTUL_0299g00010 [Botrytis tulipae]|uniref:Secreted protein n=1 Tax=Botrytis tulipae TaxID=87230 RepID=A0A4Z1E9M6_9HELO|nr:hypothetical protein BTUL_0299g00010 [Botrytis tulipae]